MLDLAGASTPGAEALVGLLMPWAMALVLALARTGGFLLGLPQTSAGGVPKTIVAIAALALSVALIGVDPAAVTRAPSDLPLLVLQAVGEFLFGLGLGFIIQMALGVAQAAGEIVGVEMGLSFAAIADPMSSEQSTAPAAMFKCLATALFLALGLDRVAIRGLARSLQAQPLGTGHLDAATIEMVLSLADRLVRAAFSLGLPLLAALLCLKLALAMLARVAPKLQIFNLSFSLTIVVGLLVLVLSWPSLVQALAADLRSWMELLVRMAVRSPA